MVRNRYITSCQATRWHTGGIRHGRAYSLSVSLSVSFIIVFVSPCLKLGQFLGVLPLTARLTILGEFIDDIPLAPIWVSTLPPISTTV